MSDKKCILILTDWFTPGYKAGGPIRSVQNLVDAFADDFEFSVLTGDRDLLDAEAYKGVQTDRWIEVQGYRVMYTSPESRAALMSKVIQEERFEKVYMNSFFSVSFTIRPLLQLRSLGLLQTVVLAPRGMLGEGALQLKATKKQIFIFAFRLLALHKRLVFHSTDPSETKSIRKVFGQAQIREASNVPVAVDDSGAKPRHHPLKLVFASRISPKKNLDLFLQIMHRVKAPIELAVFGAADDDAYMQRCRALASKDSRVSIKGAVPPHELKKALSESDFFVLPTRNENFGHSIIESLAVGTPVLISDQTPWNDLEARGAGRVIPYTNETNWEQALAALAVISEEAYSEMVVEARRYVSDKFDIDELREKYKALFS